MGGKAKQFRCSSTNSILSPAQWKSQINSASYLDSQVSDALAYFDIASSTSSSSPITPSVIKQKFNALAKLHHPDKGGNTSDFLTLRKHLKTLIERYHHD